MKRNALLLIPLAIILCGCSNDNSSTSSTSSPTSSEPASVIPNQEAVNELKSLLNKQDLSESNTKYLKGIYTQDYDVLDIDNDFDISDDFNEEKTSNYFNYGGYGFFGFYYDLTDDQYDSIADDYGNIDIFDAIAVGKGYYGLNQLSRSMSFKREGSTEAKINNLDVYQAVTVKNVNQDIWVENSLDVSETGIFDGDATQRFNATINKDLLFGSVSTRTFREIFSQIDLFNTPGNVEHLDKLYFSICHQLLSSSDQEISDFILDNQISILEEEDNTKLDFVFSTEEIGEEEVDYIFPGAIKGTISFSKETQGFINFSYEMLYNLETYDEDTGSVKYINTKFTCTGETAHELPDDHLEPINPTVYDDVAEFLKDVNEQVVPPNIYL